MIHSQLVMKEANIQLGLSQRVLNHQTGIGQVNVMVNLTIKYLHKRTEICKIRVIRNG